MLKNAFKKYPPQNRTNVQIKGGRGSKAFWTMFKKTALFWKEGIPYWRIILTLPPQHTLQHLQIVRNITAWQDSFFSWTCLLLCGWKWVTLANHGGWRATNACHLGPLQAITRHLLTIGLNESFWGGKNIGILLWATDSDTELLWEYEYWDTGYWFEALTLTQSFWGSMNIGKRLVIWGTDSDSGSLRQYEHRGEGRTR